MTPEASFAGEITRSFHVTGGFGHAAQLEDGRLVFCEWPQRLEPGRKVRAWRLGGIELRTEPGLVWILWGGGRAVLPTLPASDFPDLAFRDDQDEACALPASFAGDILQRVRPFVGREETRYYLNGICLDGLNGAAVATDGHRLLAATLPEPLASQLGAARPIVPISFVNRWIEASIRQEAQIVIQRSLDAGRPVYVKVWTDDVRLIGRLIELEARSSFSFQGDRWLADLSPELLSPILQSEVIRGKAAGATRRALEAGLPADLRYVKGWPTRLPTDAEAAQIAAVRARLLAQHELPNLYPAAPDVIARFADLLADKAAKEAA